MAKSEVHVVVESNKRPIVLITGDYINKRTLLLVWKSIKHEHRLVVAAHRKKRIIADYEAGKEEVKNDPGRTEKSTREEITGAVAGGNQAGSSTAATSNNGAANAVKGSGGGEGVGSGGGKKGKS